MSGIAPSAGTSGASAEPDTNARRFDIGAGPIAHLPMIFAAKTTASGLISLLIAFTFNLDQPQWALLTVFIVSQPQSGLVLGKSFYRIIGTLVGAVVALLLVALFAQERVLFLGVLALWIGVCTFGSQYARNFAAYSFVLSGYTAAIVGIPAALEANNAFYIATRASPRSASASSSPPRSTASSCQARLLPHSGNPWRRGARRLSIISPRCRKTAVLRNRPRRW